MTTATLTRAEGLNVLDDLRETLIHSATCEQPGAQCPACDADHLIARVTRDLYDSYPLADAVQTAALIALDLPYALGRDVKAIVARIAE
jgi:hypothetical protein